jgi:hypothetical protein
MYVSLTQNGLLVYLSFCPEGAWLKDGMLISKGWTHSIFTTAMKQLGVLIPHSFINIYYVLHRIRQPRGTYPSHVNNDPANHFT